MNSFIFKYIVSMLVIGVLILFTDNMKTECLLFISGCIVMLAFVESLASDW